MRFPSFRCGCQLLSESYRSHQVAVLLKFHRCRFPVIARRHNYTTYWSSGFYSLSASPSSLIFPELSCVVDALTGEKHSTVCCSLLFDKLWLSVIFSIGHKKKFLWWGIRTTLTWVLQYVFRIQLGGIFIWGSARESVPLDSCTCTSGSSRCMQLAVFTVQDEIFLLLSGPIRQLLLTAKIGVPLVYP